MEKFALHVLPVLLIYPAKTDGRSKAVHDPDFEIHLIDGTLANPSGLQWLFRN